MIGGGAAGMIAAYYAAAGGASVTLFEKNEKLGKKVYITGKGRCNVTNLCDVEEFLREVPRNPRFLYSALDFFGPEDMRRLLAEYGCETKVERGRRVFPVSDKASDVTAALQRALVKSGVEIRFHTTVSSLLIENGSITGVKTENGRIIPADAVIVCTGGLSYPSTGSTGDGYAFAHEAGLNVTDTMPSLTGLETEEKWPGVLQGLSLKNVALSARKNGKKLYDNQGEMLFTHYGISGPLVLELSAHMPPDGAAEAKIDLKPALTEEQLLLRLKRDIAENSKKRLQTLLEGLMPRSMAEIMPGLLEMDGTIPCGRLNGEQQSRIVHLLKGIPLSVTGLRPYTEAVVTRGGVSTKEINPSAMRSKKIAGLYFAGEVLDVDAHTGGYNLQIAFSTGALAGKSAAEG